MKVGISLKIDVTKIDKARLFQGQKGKYLDLTTFIDLDVKDQYGNNGFVTQSTTKEEREQGIQTAILGNVNVFMADTQQQPAQQQYQQAPSQHQPKPSHPPKPQTAQEFEDDIPF